MKLHPIKPGLKTPLTAHGKDDATDDPAQLAAWRARWPDANWAVHCGASGLIVVDLDVRNGATEADLLALPPSYTVRSGGGGWHVYYSGRCPSRAKIQPGVDIKSDDGYILIPPAYTDEATRTKDGRVWGDGHYSVLHDRPIQPAPAWLIAAANAAAPSVRSVEPSDCPPELTRDDRWLEYARAHLKNLQAAVAGDGGTPAWTVAGIMMRGWLLPAATVDALLRAEWCPRCTPPWRFEAPGDEANWQHTLESAESTFPCAWGEHRPRLTLDRWANHPDDLKSFSNPTQTPSAVIAPTQADGAWTLLQGSLMGAPYAVERALRQFRNQHTRRAPGTEPELPNSSAVIKWLVNAKAWSPDLIASQLGRDAGDFAVSLRAPEVQSVGRLAKIDQLLGGHDLRLNELGMKVEIDGVQWNDDHTAAIRLALEQCGASEPEKPIPNGDIEQRARALAGQSPYHPVVEYLTALPPWDGTPRADRLWVHYFGAEDDAGGLNLKLGACFCLAAVRRALEPGCKFDLLMILLGDQGDFKSTALEVLAGGSPLFTDAAPQFGHRAENAMTLSGCWVWEIAEMQGMDRAELNAVKAFVSRKFDDVLLPYARAKTQLLRRSVMVGTTNDDQCLTDPTGSRRHPVIRIGSILREELGRDRDQIWAEALQRVRAGEPHWLDKPSEKAVGVRNVEHTKRDESLIEQIEAWLDAPQAERFRTATFGAALSPFRPRFTVKDVALYALKQSATDRALETRIGVALKSTRAVFVGRLGVAKIRTWTFPDTAGAAPSP